MAVIPLKAFTGEIPRTAAHLLADNAAQSAIDCDLAYGELKGIKQRSLVRGGMVIAPKSFYTDDGSKFYIWDKQVETAQSPVIGDIHRRLYYTVQNGTDTRVVARSGVYAEPPAAYGFCPIGYKVGVPSPLDVMFSGLAGLNARLINYDTGASVKNIDGYSWLPIVDGLSLNIKFFYELDGVKYQETDLLAIHGGDYGSVPFVSMRPYQKYADSANNLDVNIFGRDFHVACPAKKLSPTENIAPITRIVTTFDESGAPIFNTETVNEVVTVTEATYANAKPMLHVTGLVDGSQIFSVYSEGSVFASNRGWVAPS